MEKRFTKSLRLKIHFGAANKDRLRLTGINSYSTEYTALQDTYVPEENSSGSNVYVNGNSTVTELPTPSRGMVRVKVSSKVHPESEINLRCLDKLGPTGKLAAV